jgi:23S rRNA (pseudouridine1915-N3)-methyltransferase
VRLRVIAVGRLKSAAEQLIAEDYLKRAARLGRQLGVTGVSLREVPESRAADARRRQAEEAGDLLAAVPPKAHLIALDNHGKELDSEAFASKLRRMADAGIADLVLIIGGPDGLGHDVLERADLKLSLGRMTWPHRLVRAMLAEQIYRSVTILLNHPYHRA